MSVVDLCKLPRNICEWVAGGNGITRNQMLYCFVLKDMIAASAKSTDDSLC